MPQANPLKQIVVKQKEGRLEFIPAAVRMTTLSRLHWNV